MSIAISLPDEPLVARLTLEHFNCQVRADVVLHVAQLAILDMAVEAGQLLQPQARLLVQIVALGEARIDLFFYIIGGGDFWSIVVLKSLFLFVGAYFLRGRFRWLRQALRDYLGCLRQCYGRMVAS